MMGAGLIHIVLPLTLLVSCTCVVPSSQFATSTRGAVGRCAQVRELLGSSIIPSISLADGIATYGPASRGSGQQVGYTITLQGVASRDGPRAANWSGVQKAVSSSTGVILRFRRLAFIDNNRDAYHRNFEFIHTHNSAIAALELHNVAILRRPSEGRVAQKCKEDSRSRTAPQDYACLGYETTRFKLGSLGFRKPFFELPGAESSETVVLAFDGTTVGREFGSSHEDEAEILRVLRRFGLQVCSAGQSINRVPVRPAGISLLACALILLGGAVLLLGVAISLSGCCGKCYGARRELKGVRAVHGLPRTSCSIADGLEGLSLAEIEIGSPLGRGGFGKVHKGFFRGNVVAVKIIEHDMSVVERYGEPLEALLSKKLQHPNIVKTYLNQTRGRDSIHASLSTRPQAFPRCQSSEEFDWCQGVGIGMEPSDIDDFSYLARNLKGCSETNQGAYRTWIIMEFCDKGSLYDAIAGGKFFFDEERRELNFASILLTALDVAQALTYLHSKKVIHGDLKSHNVLLKSSIGDARGFCCKVGDFGLSRVSINGTHIETFTCGTVRYMPPELLKDGLLTPATDVYSFGILLWELLAGGRPYRGRQQNDIVVDVVNGKRPAIPSHWPMDVALLIRQCWHQDRNQRPTFIEIVNRMKSMKAACSLPLSYALVEEEDEDLDLVSFDARGSRESHEEQKPLARKSRPSRLSDASNEESTAIHSPSLFNS